MGEVAGVKGLRLMEGQPVALGPLGPDFSQGKQYRLELTLDDGSVQNITISKLAYEELMVGLYRQGVTLEQRLVARAIVASEKDHTVVAEKVMPLDVSAKGAVEALKSVGQVAYEAYPKAETPAPSNSRLLDLFQSEEAEYDDRDDYEDPYNGDDD